METKATNCATLATQLGPEEYHLWRARGAFHTQVEYPFLVGLLRSYTPQRVFDIGTGTGLWATICAAMFPEAEVVGIDCERSFLEFARLNARRRIGCLYADLTKEVPPGAADLLVCAMSVDYIGCDAVADLLPRVLLPGGYGILWYLDQMHYQKEGARCLKHWRVDRRNVEVSVCVLEDGELASRVSRLGLEVTPRTTSFFLEDGRQRILRVLIVRKPKEGRFVNCKRGHEMIRAKLASGGGDVQLCHEREWSSGSRGHP